MTFGPFLYFVPSITILILQYCSCWSCFSEIKNKSTANVRVFPSRKNFVERKEKCSENYTLFCIAYSIGGQTEEIHKPFKFCARKHLPLEFVWSIQPWSFGSSVVAAAAPSMPELLRNCPAQHTQLGAVDTWRVMERAKYIVCPHFIQIRYSRFRGCRVGRVVISFKEACFLIIIAIT